MDQQNANTNTASNKKGREIDIREIGSFLLSKLWIIALVVLCCFIIAFLYTRVVIRPLYTSQSKVLIANNSSSSSSNDSLQSSDISIAIHLTKSSEEIFTGYDFLYLVAETLNHDAYFAYPDLNDEANKSFYSSEKSNKDKISELSWTGGSIKVNGKAFTEYYGSKISPSTLRSLISVSADEDARTLTLTVTTPYAQLSAIISEVATYCMQYHMNIVNKSDSVIVGHIDSGGRVPTTPSNKHTLRNMLISAAIGFVVICAVLTCFYIFDDKIKVPDDIEKHLRLNVLGEIPEIEET